MCMRESVMNILAYVVWMMYEYVCVRAMCCAICTEWFDQTKYPIRSFIFFLLLLRRTSRDRRKKNEEANRMKRNIYLFIYIEIAVWL